MHQCPFRVMVLSLVLDLTATRSEKIVTKSRVVSFFTISISGMFEWWTSSRLLMSYGRVSSNYSYVEPALTLLLSASSPVPLPSSSSEISSTSSSSSSISSSGIFLALLREWPWGFSPGSSSELDSSSDAGRFRFLFVFFWLGLTWRFFGLVGGFGSYLFALWHFLGHVEKNGVW